MPNTERDVYSDPAPRPLASAARALLAALLLAAPGADFRGAEPSLYPWEGARLAEVPPPEAVLSYRIGERLIGHADAERYLDALDAASDRVRLFGYARSHEGRLLRYAVLSSPENMARLDEHREALKRLANPSGLGAAEADALIRATPVLVWLSYSVHGNEHSSTEAALAVAYHLASAQDERTLRILEKAIIAVDPIQNPDGRDRFISSYSQAAGGAPAFDPAAVEHDEPWPSGRFNHDLFDLNRDWLWQTQPETRGKVAAFLAWRPQVFVDHHEMGTDETYYFAPPRAPINANVSESILKWFKVLGEGNAKVFDALGFDYFTEEVFDLFYPGYGDSWPSLNGAVGMTYEEASASGLAIEKKDGSRLTLRDAARRHIAAGLATAETAAAHREEILRDYFLSRRAALDEGAPGVKAYVIPADTGGADSMARLLTAHGVEVRRFDDEFSVRAAPDAAASPEARRFPRGSFVVPLAQSARRLVTALFERDPRLDEATLKEATERRRLHEDLPFFDITAWSLPLAMNVQAYAATEAPRGAFTPLPQPGASGLPGHAQPPPGFGAWPPAAAHGGAAPPVAQASYAYLLRPTGNDALAAFVFLLAHDDLSVEVAAKKFTLAGNPCPPGTAVLKVHRNPPALHAAVAEAAARFGAVFDAAATGLTEEGIDLGSSSVVAAKMPRIAVVYGEPASPTSVGWLTYTLGERYGVPFVPVRARTLVHYADLRRYDVIVIPDGSASGYADVFGKKGVEQLKAWIEAGGTVVTIKGASAFAADKNVAWTGARAVKRPRGAPIVPAAAAPPEEAKEPSKETPPSLAARGSGNAGTVSPSEEEPGEEGEEPEAIPGAILRVLIEPSHPVAFGYAEEVPVLVNSNLVLSLSKDGVNAGVFASRDRIRLGGFAWKESLDLLAGKAYLVVERVGRGSVVLFSEDPNFRGGWEGLNRMLLNAVLLVPAFEP